MSHPILHPSTRLRLTDKGTDEVAHRTFRLGIRPRSILLLLQHPQTVEFALHKSVFPDDEVVAAIGTLLQDGFIATDAETAAGNESTAAATTSSHGGVSDQQRDGSAPDPSPPGTAEAAGAGLELDEGILLSEARFLLIDFCVDCFGMQAEKLTGDIRASRNVGMLRPLLREVQAQVKSGAPGRLEALEATVRKINETA